MSFALIALDGVLIAAYQTDDAGFPGARTPGRPVWEGLGKGTERLRLQQDVARAATGSVVSSRVTFGGGKRGTTAAVQLTPLRDAAGAVRFILASIAAGTTVEEPGPLGGGDLASRLVHRVNNSVNGVKAALAVLRNAVPPAAQDLRLLRLVDEELDRLAAVAREVADAHDLGN